MEPIWNLAGIAAASAHVALQLIYIIVSFASSAPTISASDLFHIGVRVDNGSSEDADGIVQVQLKALECA